MRGNPGRFLLHEIKLAEGGVVPEWIQLLRVGSFKHPRYGKFTITAAMLSEFKQNFDNRVRGIDIALDYYHDADQDASGWLKSVDVREEELWGKVDWTPTAKKKLAEKELRYFSPEFEFVWENPETGEKINNVLFGGGLTNRPFVKEMQPITAAEEREDMDLKQALAEIERLKGELANSVKLAEVVPGKDARIAELEKTIADAQAELAKIKGEQDVVMGENKKLAQENCDMKTKLAESVKEQEFNVLLSEGKACAAQKDAFMKNDVAAYAKLAEKVNVKASGNGNTDNGDRNEKILKLAEEKRKADPKLSQGDAISAAMTELK